MARSALFAAVTIVASVGLLACGLTRDYAEDAQSIPSAEDDDTADDTENGAQRDDSRDSTQNENDTTVDDVDTAPPTQPDDQGDDVPEDNETDGDDTTTENQTCAPDDGVYEYCNSFTPCRCGNICAKDIMEASSAVVFDPISSLCLAECDIDVPTSCPNSWEQCGKMRTSDRQAFCMPQGRVRGSWRGRVLEMNIDLSDEDVVRNRYLIPNDGIVADIPWWQPMPDFNRGMVAYGSPESSQNSYYIITLIPDEPTEHGNVKDKWYFEVFVEASQWRAATINLSSDPDGFLVQPVLIRLVKPNVSLRTWLVGIARTSSTLTINEPGELCTDMENIESCLVASGTMDIQLWGLGGTTAER